MSIFTLKILLWVIFIPLCCYSAILTGYETTILSNDGITVEVSCKIEDSNPIDDTLIKWIDPAAGGVTLEISHERVLWDSGTKITKLKISTIPSTNTDYTCSYPTSSDVASPGPRLTIISFSESPSTTDIGKDNSYTITCLLSDTSYSGSWSWYKDGSEMASTQQDIHKDQSNSITLQLSGEVSSAGDYMCKAVFPQDGTFNGGTLDSPVATITVADVQTQDVIVLSGGTALLSCDVTAARREPDTMYFTVSGGDDIVETYGTFADGAKSMTAERDNMVHDTTYTCVVGWNTHTYSYDLNVDVIALTFPGTVVAAGGSPVLECTMTGASSDPDLLTWSRGDTVIATISDTAILSSSPWRHPMSGVTSADAVSYSCGVTFGGDVLSVANEVVVVDITLTPAPLTGRGSDLVLTCSAAIHNFQTGPTSSYWTNPDTNQIAGVMTTSGNTAQSTLALTGVTGANEIPYSCSFLFPDQTTVTSASTVTPDILLFETEPQSQFAAFGDSVTFTCAGERGNSGAGTPDTNWYSMQDDSLVQASSITYSVTVSAGLDLKCQVTWSNTGVTVFKEISLLLAGVSGQVTQYVTRESDTADLTCSLQTTGGGTPTIGVKWYRIETDTTLTDVDTLSGVTVNTGQLIGNEQITTLTITSVTMATLDGTHYKCEFTVDGTPISYSTQLRVLGIQLNKPSDLAVKSGESVNLQGIPMASYDITPSTWSWHRASDPSTVIENSDTLTFTSLRVGDGGTYEVRATFEIDIDGHTHTYETKDAIQIDVTPSCSTGTLTNVKNGNIIPQFVDNGWSMDIHCLDNYMLDDQSYNTVQSVACVSSDFVQLDITSCVGSCQLTVLPNDTTVTWKGNVLDVGSTHLLYPGDTFQTHCDGSRNKTLPSGSAASHTCRDRGHVTYSLCNSGCSYIMNDKINITLPDNIHNPQLIPIGETVVYECLKGDDNVYNPSKSYTCTPDFINKRPINLAICDAAVRWDWIFVGFAIVLTVIAIGMMVWGALLFLQRQKTKRRMMENGTSTDVYINPSAKEADVESEQVEMNDMCKSIDISSFHNSYKRLMVDDCYALSVEYAQIAKEVPPDMFTTTVGAKPENKAKNRYTDILPYDATRVTLQQIGDDPNSTYINANYVHTLDEARRFIAAQGPKPETLTHFWRMIWEQNSQVIIMVTNFYERGCRKCEEYWHDAQIQTYGSYTVECLGLVSFPDYKVRKLSVTQEGDQKARFITHYHYEGWPDHGVPDTPTSMIAFARRAFSDNNSGPLVIHCSAGAGRTGTLIALFLQMENIIKDKRINIYDTVVQLRKCRKIMVQTETQYVFIYQAVNEILRCGETEILSQHISQKYRDLQKVVPATGITGIQTEYQRLVYIANEDMTEKFTEAVKEYNLPKNRYHNILPFEKNRVKLAYQTGVPGSDYINASYVASHHERGVFIATQAPKATTLIDFWKMVYETGCSTIVCMTRLTENGKTKCAQYWPTEEGGVAEYGLCSVKLVALEEDKDVVRREMCLTNTAAENSQIRLVRMWHFTTLAEQNMQLDGLKMISVIESMSRWQKQQGNTPAIVHCGGGVGRAAAFIGIANSLEQLKLEGTVDIFQTVLQLRRDRPFMIQSVDQYDYVYRALVQYVESFETYENFK